LRHGWCYGAVRGLLVGRVDDGGYSWGSIRVERTGRVRASSRPVRVRWYYSETVKPCSVPYLMLASCQLFSPSLSGVSET
jgi:hypothetical protein